MCVWYGFYWNLVLFFKGKGRENRFVTEEKQKTRSDSFFSNAKIIIYGCFSHFGPNEKIFFEEDLGNY